MAETKEMTGTKEFFVNLLMENKGIERIAEGFAALYKAIAPYKGQLFAELALKYEPHPYGIPGCVCGDENGTATTLMLEAQIMTGTISDLVYDPGTRRLRISEKSQKWSIGIRELKTEEITSPFDQLKVEHYQRQSSQENGAVIWNGYLPVSFMKHGGYSDLLAIRVRQRKGTSGNARAIVIGTNNVLAAFGLEGVEGITDPDSLYTAFTSRIACADKGSKKLSKREEELNESYLSGPLADVVYKLFRETIFKWFEIEKPDHYGEMELNY